MRKKISLVPNILKPDRLILVLIIIGAFFLSGANQQKFLGIGLVFITAVVFYSGKYNERWRRSDIPNELIFFGIWIVWAFLTGLFTADIQWYFRQQMFRLTQIYALMVCFFILLKIKPTFHYVYLSFILVALAQGYMSQTGLMQIVDESWAGSANIEDVRAEGVGNAVNPNALATLMVSGSFFAAFFWKTPGNWPLIKKGLILAVMAVAAFVILRSGSRKGVLYFAIVTVGWAGWVLPPGRGIGGWLLRLLLLFLFASLVVTVAPVVLRGTAAGERWAEFLGRGDSLGGRLENEVRYWLFKDGLRMVRQNPIAGVGHAHFRIHSFNKLTSHSDIIEPLANTGIVGFILYQMFHVLPLLRLLKLRKLQLPPVEDYHVKLMILICVYYLIYGLGFYKYQSQSVMITMVTIITYSHLLMQKYQGGYAHPFRAPGGFPGRPAYV